MKKLTVLFIGLFFTLAASPAWAVYDPLSVSNNRVGIHILSPDEIEPAAKLVNADYKGAWGYVTVPIQATDRNRDRWVAFMKKAAEIKVIPIIRVATFGDGPHWLRPEDNDLIDFANFLNDLPWPTQNHYVIIFNEVNRADEYGGSVSPEDYADILNNAIDIFKRRSDKFFILPSALDNAAPNSGQFMRWDVYLKRMYAHRPEVFEKIDGWNSHAYGNPAFSSSPALSGTNKADSFKSDLAFINQFTKRKLPVFITEAGWSNENLDERTIATYYNHAFYNVWSNDQVVAVTPFLLFAGTTPFSHFSLLNKDHHPTLAYQTIQTYASVGSPKLEDYSPTPTPQMDDIAQVSPEDLPVGQEVLGETTSQPGLSSIWQKVISFISSIFHHDNFTRKVTVGEKTFRVEVVSTGEGITKGLAKYGNLNLNQGMLFDFGRQIQPDFWMKNMKFNIDIVWINQGKVVGVSPGYYKTPLTLIPAPAPVTYVLEVNPNSGIRVGDSVKIN